MKRLFFALIPFFSILLLVSCNKETDLIATPDIEELPNKGLGDDLLNTLETVIGLSWDDIDEHDKTNENLKAFAQIKQVYSEMVSFALPNDQQPQLSFKLLSKGVSIVDVDWSQEMDNELILEMIRIWDGQVQTALDILRTSNDIVIPRNIPQCPNQWAIDNYGIKDYCPALDDSFEMCMC